MFLIREKGGCNYGTFCSSEVFGLSVPSEEALWDILNEGNSDCSWQNWSSSTRLLSYDLLLSQVLSLKGTLTEWTKGVPWKSKQKNTVMCLIAVPSEGLWESFRLTSWARSHAGKGANGIIWKTMQWAVGYRTPRRNNHWEVWLRCVLTFYTPICFSGVY